MSPRHPERARNPSFSNDVMHKLYSLLSLACVVSSHNACTLQPEIDYRAVESAEERAKLPLYRTIPAAQPDELTPTNGRSIDSIDWHRSHGGTASTRYSSLQQINRDNVKNLKVAWTYHSKDGRGYIQCNPIVVEGVMFAPTAGGHIVAVNAATGVELWRVRVPRGAKLPAARGLTYWPGTPTDQSRILFSAGSNLMAHDPKTGSVIYKVEAPEFTVAPAIFKNTLLFAGFRKDAFGYDVRTGEHLWTFHTIPLPGQFGHDTWDRPELGANCWGGISLDDQRGILYIATGSPKPDGNGARHRGSNLFSNCVVAIDALTGRRIWHFQEIAHDIWDLDIPSPPILVTIAPHGRKIDAVAVVTKMGNTLLLDRVTGKPIFPFRMRRAPTSTVPGERTEPYQPDVQLPEPFSRQVFTKDDITDISDDSRTFIEARLNFSNVGFFQPFEIGKPSIFYGLSGGAEWTGGSFDPSTGFLYVSANQLPTMLTLVPARQLLRQKRKRTAGQKIFNRNCGTCHGKDRRGFGLAAPLLALARIDHR